MTTKTTATFDFNQLEKELTEISGLSWSLKKDSQSYCEHYTLTLVNGNGEAIYLETGGYRTKGKISISGRFHVGHTYLYPDKDKCTDINCTVTKSPAQVAKDIKRRFLDAYLTEFDRVFKIHCYWQEAKQKRQETLINLAKILGSSCDVSLDTEKIYGRGEIETIQAYTDGQVTLNIRTNAQKVAAIVEALKA